jgi:translation initiation factor IF-2
MESRLGSEVERNVLGRLKVLAIFLNEKNRQIVGGKVLEGEMRQGAKLDVQRTDQTVGCGRIVSLQENKKDVFMVSRGRECGILFEGNVKISEGDILEAFEETRKRGEL